MATLPGLIGRAALAVLLGALVMLVALQLYFAAMIALYSQFAPGRTSFMTHRIGELRAKQPDAPLRYQWVPYERISPHLKRALIAAEDAKFVDHEGFDWEGIQLAIEKNRKRGRAVAGGSTITRPPDSPLPT